MSPRSRLSEDLYTLYLAGFGWILLPVYISALTFLFPSQWDHIDDALNLGVPLLGLVGIWSGVRGGPMLLSRSGVLHELLSASSRRAMLAPHLARQTVMWMIVAAYVACGCWAMSRSETFGYGTLMTVSGVAALAAASSSFQAVLWLVAGHTDDNSARRLVVAAAVSVPLAQTVALLIGLRFTTSWGLGVLLATVVVAALSAIVALEWAPVEKFWRRAVALESMRSAMMTFDFQRVILDLRKVTEQPLAGTSTAIPSRFLVPLWRLWAAMRHNLGWHIGRLAVLAGVVSGMYWWGDLGQGLVTLVAAACMFLVGVEISGPVAATASERAFLVHYPLGLGAVLLAQVTTTVLVGLFIGALIVGFGLVQSSPVTLGLLLLMLLGVLAATVQARLGSPDMAALVEKFGSDIARKVLLVRATLGPLLLFAATIGIYHQFFNNDVAGVPWVVSSGFVGCIGLAAFVISVLPMKGS